MKGISKYNAEGYLDPTAHAALTTVLRAERKAAKAADRPRAVSAFTYRPIVFICSPYAGDTECNTIKARDYCRFAVSEGMIPVAPHLMYPQFMDDSDPEQRELGLFFGLVLITKCVELWVFGDRITEGMKREIGKAKSRNTPIRYFTEDCKEVSHA